MNYPESVEWISGLVRYGIKLGLERFAELARRAGNPQSTFTSVHIGGTNGKGSVAAMVAGATRHAGLRTGLYLSPFVFDLRERIQIDNCMIPRETFARLAGQVRRLIEELESTPYGQATEFEAKTLIGFLYFAEEGVDIASIEVGLGGRLDATNIITPVVSVITNVSHDHMEHLGETISLIAAEKAGIVKQGIPVVSGALDVEAVRVIEQTAARMEAPLTRVLPVDRPPSGPASGASWYMYPDLESFDIQAHGVFLPNVRPRMKGAFQGANAACAAAALLEVGKIHKALCEADIRSGIEQAWLPGRLQVISERPLVVMDGAHNCAAAMEVAQYLRAKVRQRPLVLVIGMMKSHQPEEVLASLAPLADHIVITQPPDPSAQPPEVLAGAAREYGSRITIEPQVNPAVAQACAIAGPSGAVCVTGSFYLIGAVRPDAALPSGAGRAAKAEDG